MQPCAWRDVTLRERNGGSVPLLLVPRHAPTRFPVDDRRTSAGGRMKTPAIHYKRTRFTARLPEAYLYSPSHFWLYEMEPGIWQVGFTTFATRMLGDLVEFEFKVAPGTAVETGQAIGWTEGFKALSDIYSAATGDFLGAN